MIIPVVYIIQTFIFLKIFYLITYIIVQDYNSTVSSIFLKIV